MVNNQCLKVRLVTVLSHCEEPSGAQKWPCPHLLGVKMVASEPPSASGTGISSWQAQSPLTRPGSAAGRSRAQSRDLGAGGLWPCPGGMRGLWWVCVWGEPEEGLPQKAEARGVWKLNEVSVADGLLSLSGAPKLFASKPLDSKALCRSSEGCCSASGTLKSSVKWHKDVADEVDGLGRMRWKSH